MIEHEPQKAELTKLREAAAVGKLQQEVVKLKEALQGARDAYGELKKSITGGA